jgi:hypothetical protein
MVGFEASLSASAETVETVGVVAFRVSDLTTFSTGRENSSARTTGFSW